MGCESPRRLWVIGDPVEHSKSPAIHTAMLSTLGLCYVYHRQPVAPSELPNWLARAREMDCAGFNVTMPHKEAIIPLLDVVDDRALRCGAVNTVCNENGRLYGYNTDGPGFLRALDGAGFDPRDKEITLLGAGGAAKAVALHLAWAGARRVHICNRTLARGAALAALDDTGRLAPAGFDAATLEGLCARSELLVNCTNLGMTGGGGQFDGLTFVDALPQGALVCDLIYSPPKTPLLAYAQERGRPILNGLPLLLHQAILALAHFTGLELDADALLPVAEGALA